MDEIEEQLEEAWDNLAEAHLHFTVERLPELAPEWKRDQLADVQQALRKYAEVLARLRKTWEKSQT